MLGRALRVRMMMRLIFNSFLLNRLKFPFIIDFLMLIIRLLPFTVARQTSDTAIRCHAILLLDSLQMMGLQDIGLIICAEWVLLIVVIVTISTSMQRSIFILSQGRIVCRTLINLIYLSWST